MTLTKILNRLIANAAAAAVEEDTTRYAACMALAEKVMELIATIGNVKVELTA